jgi:hypothetical protein
VLVAISASIRWRRTAAAISLISRGARSGDTLQRERHLLPCRSEAARGSR